MDIDRIYHTSNRPPRVGDWGAVPELQTSAFLTTESLPLRPDRLRQFQEIWTYGLGSSDIGIVLAEARPTLLSIAHSRNADLGTLATHSQLRALAIDWNGKTRALEMLQGMDALEILSLQDMTHVHDLGPLAELAALRGLQIAGGMDSKMEIQSLAPLAGLAQLEDLRLAAISLVDPSLEPLAGLPRLKSLSIPGYAAPWEEFARLSALLPDVRCDQLQPYVRTDCGIVARGDDPVALLDTLGDTKVVLTGKRMPTLRARSDRERVLKHCQRFLELRAATSKG